jgi:hypothetical protein
VPRLVEHHVDAAGQHHRRDDPEPLVLGLAPELDALRLEVGLRRGDVVAHERQLVCRALRAVPAGGVHAHLGRRQREDQPTVPGVDVVEPEHVAQRRPQRLRFRGVQQSVRSDDPHCQIVHE